MYLMRWWERFRLAGEDFSKTRVVFGPVEIFDAADPKNNIRIVSIGDLPVPVPLLLEYMIGKASSQARVQFDFHTFMERSGYSCTAQLAQ